MRKCIKAQGLIFLTLVGNRTIMKKLWITVLAVATIGVAAYAQTQRTSRTNKRVHDRSEVTKEEVRTDQDKNNPNQKAPAKTTKDTLKKQKEKAKK